MYVCMYVCMYGRLLEVSACANVRDYSLVRIAQRCKGLVTLTCCFCRGLTDVTLTALGQFNFSHLKELNVGYNHAITLSGMLTLLMACRGTERVFCIECANLTDADLEQLRIRFPYLQLNPNSRWEDLT